MNNKLLLFAMCGLFSIGIVGCGVVDSDKANEAVQENNIEEQSKDIEEAENTINEDENEEIDEDVTIEVVDAEAHSEEYMERLNMEERVGSTYIKSGDAEVSEFSDWKAGYLSLIDDLGSDNIESSFSLIYVDDDDIPELVYTTVDSKIAIASFCEPYVNIFSSQIDDLYYYEKNNVVMASESVEANLNDYIVALKDGYFVEIAYGTRRPLDEWAEDSFDENGNPIISYWEINGEEIKSQLDYDDLMNKFFSSSYRTKVTDFKNAEDTKKMINSL